MDFAEELSALGDELDREKDAHQRAVAARGAASQIVASRFDDIRTFLRQRGIGPYPVVKWHLPTQSAQSQQRRRAGFTRGRGQPPKAEPSALLQLLDTGWDLPGIAFVSDQGGLFEGDFLYMDLRKLVSKPDLSLPPGLRPGQQAYVLTSTKEFPTTPMLFDADSIVPVSDFGGGDRGRKNYDEFTAKGYGTLPVPRGIGDRKRGVFFGVTHDGLPVRLNVWTSEEGTTHCDAGSLDQQLQKCLADIVR